MESSGVLHALLTMWMVFPIQAAALQGSLCVNRDLLVVNDLGIGADAFYLALCWQVVSNNWRL